MTWKTNVINICCKYIYTYCIVIISDEMNFSKYKNIKLL